MRYSLNIFIFAAIMLVAPMVQSAEGDCEAAIGTPSAQPVDQFYTFFHDTNPVLAIEEKIAALEKESADLKHRLNQHYENSQKFFFFFYERLSKHQISTFNQQIAANKKSIAKAVEDIKAIKKTLTEPQQRVLTAALSDNNLRLHVVDRLKYLTVKNLKSTRTVSVAMGNMTEEPSQELVKQAQILVQNLVNLNYNIVFDADSKLAPVIAQVAGKQAIGVALTTPVVYLPCAVLVMNNVYHKFQSLNHGHLRIADPSSSSGLAQFFTSDLDIMLDPDKRWNVGGFANWEQQLNKEKANIGIKTPSVWAPFYADTALTFKYKDKKGNWVPLLTEQQPRPPLSFTKTTALNYDQVQSVRSYVRQMAYTAAPLTGLRGSVIFGSSGLHRAYAEGAYNVAYALASTGVSVRTGGAGGLMLAANMGAFDAGGTSIGIPRIAGALTKEHTFPTELHTHTVFTEDYSTRIPLLLDADLVVFQPGRDGTLRELGITLMQHATRASTAPVIFFNSAFYQPLYSWLKGLPSVHAFAADLSIMDDPAQIAAFANQLPLTRLPMPLPPSVDRQRFPMNHDGLEAP